MSTTRADREAAMEVEALYEDEIMTAAIAYARVHDYDDLDELMDDLRDDETVVGYDLIDRDEADRRIRVLAKDDGFVEVYERRYGELLDADPLEIDRDIREMIEERMEPRIVAKLEYLGLT